MNEIKFTKGEWEVVIGDEVSKSTLRVFGGVVCVSYNGHQCEESIANAHLIAAAPEMYKMLDLITDSSNMEDAEHALRENFQEALKLLAKARGENNE